MASTQAPLFGLDASGSIGGAITFAKWRGRTYARVKSTPSNPNSASQKSTRAMMRFLTTVWAGLSAADKATWQNLADAENYSTFNAFCKYNMRRWTQYTTPYDRPTPTAGTVPVMGAQTLTAGVGQFSLSQAITTANGIWGIIVTASTTTGYTPGKANVVRVEAYSSSPVTCVVTGLGPGTWYVRTAGFTKDGDLSSYVAEGTVVVT